MRARAAGGAVALTPAADAAHARLVIMAGIAGGGAAGGAYS